MFLGDNNDGYDSGKGNDTVFGGSGFDAVGFGTLYDAAGNQTNITTGSICDLAITAVQDFGLYGKDRISGFEMIYGGDGADRFFGNGAQNVLSGNGGNDLLDGRGGDDELDGDQGRDRLIGGRGADWLKAGEDRDKLTGGAGADNIDLIDMADARDIIRYTKISDSETGLSRQRLDVIDFFDFGAEATADRIDLSAIDANRALAGNQAFIFRGANAFSSAAGEVRLEVTEFGDTLIQVDIDGDGASEMNILMDNTVGLTVVDFIL
jgi:serralysin